MVPGVAATRCNERGCWKTTLQRFRNRFGRRTTRGARLWNRFFLAPQDKNGRGEVKRALALPWPNSGLAGQASDGGPFHPESTFRGLGLSPAQTVSRIDGWKACVNCTEVRVVERAAHFGLSRTPKWAQPYRACLGQTGHDRSAGSGRFLNAESVFARAAALTGQGIRTLHIHDAVAK